MSVEVTSEQLGSSDAHRFLRLLRNTNPVVWIADIGAWLVTDRATAVTVLRDPQTFTVDDPRFSTAVVVGTSMLSTEGDEHARHRAPFAAPFTGLAVNTNYSAAVVEIADGIVASVHEKDQADLRTDVAGPVAVAVITKALGLVDVDEAEVLAWYRSIVRGVDRVSAGLAIEHTTVAGLDSLRDAVETAARSQEMMLSRAAATLNRDEVFANTAVLMFGAIETSEGMTANALWHLLHAPGVLKSVQEERSYVAELIEESLRCEPAAAVVDRYATCDVELANMKIATGDLVRVSLTAANRDPDVFHEPDVFDLDRSNARQHLAFVVGPHVCLGLHLARAQTAAVVNSVLEHMPRVQLDERASAPAGLIFRKPDSLAARW